MNAHIAVDIGGTQMRAASFVTQSLVPIKINRIQSQIQGITPRERLIQVVESVWPEDVSVESIGIAVAGPLNLKLGLIQKSPNIPDFDEFPVVQFLEEHFNTAVFLGNDANLAALGEWKYGAGQGHQDLIYLTISTGIGSGVISGGSLLLGAQGMAAELGHVTIYPGGPICSCGKAGHLEAISSGTAIAKWVRSEIKNGVKSKLGNHEEITAHMVADAVKSGDPLAKSAYQRAGKTLGIAIVNFLHIFNPTIIIFGGGVSKSIDLLLPYIETALKTDVFAPGYTKDLVLTTAALGDDAGLLGALALARDPQLQS
jgi:glucokinase